MSIGEILDYYIPGGAHTYARAKEAWPANAPAAIRRGKGAYVWDVNENRFIDWNMSLTSVAFGYADEEINRAAIDAMGLGNSFTRPSEVEAKAAMRLIEFLGDRGEMVKFTKTGSDATEAAVRLARAYTGRDYIGVCADQPFFGTGEWFIGTTPCCAGIPESHRQHTLPFFYNDLDSVLTLFATHPNEIAALILEPMRFKHPADKFLDMLRIECDRHGTLLIFDEMIGGFKFSAQGAAKFFGASADLYTWGKGLGNGHSVAAITGSREVMSRAGLAHRERRVFFASSTHGAETPPLAAMMKVLDRVQADPAMFERNRKKAGVMRAEINTLVQAHGLGAHLALVGDNCHFMVDILDAGKHPLHVAKTYLLQELIRRGQLFSGNFYTTVAHNDAIIEETIGAWSEALPLYAAFLNGDDTSLLVGPPVKAVLRGFNYCACTECSAAVG